MAAEAEFRALVERHHALVFGAAVMRCRDRALAEDITQEAFLRAWLDRGALRDPARIGAWVAGIASNLAASEQRRRQRRERLAPRLTTDEPPTPRASLERKRDRAGLCDAVAALPATYREPLLAFYVEGRSVSDIARRANTTSASVRQRLRRGRRALRALLGAGGLLACVRTASAQKVWIAMTMKKLAVVVLIAAIATWAVLRRDTPSVAVAPAPAGSALGSVPRDTSPSGSAIGPVPRGTSPGVRRLADPAAAAALRRAIEGARARRTEATTAPALPETLDEDYIRAAVREIAPLVMECFEEGLGRGALGDGDVVVKMTIEGEAEVGAVVADSSLEDAETTLVDPTVRACIRDTMYAIEIDAPLAGGRIEVRKRFTFRRTR